MLAPGGEKCVEGVCCQAFGSVGGGEVVPVVEWSVVCVPWFLWWEAARQLEEKQTSEHKAKTGLEITYMHLGSVPTGKYLT